jgi:myo-inositol-1(or 4)-monophosphatase
MKNFIMSERYKFIILLVQDAGKLLLKLQEKKLVVGSKGKDLRDVVTDADIKVNNFLIKEINSKFPEEEIYSEETAGSKNKSDTYWALDPIDGTSNFARGIPHFAIVVSFFEKGIPIVGAVFNPITNELFSFEKGRGVFLNQKRIVSSNIKDLKNAYTILHIGRKESVREWGINLQRIFLGSTKKTINLASSALDLCFLASGRVDAVVYGTLSTKDIAVAIAMVREAGGEVYILDGNPVKFINDSQQIIATSTKELFEEIKSSSKL